MTPSTFFFFRIVRNTGRLICESVLRTPYTYRKFKIAAQKNFLKFRRSVGAGKNITCISTVNLAVAITDETGLERLEIRWGTDYG